jgi:hypothetical protein
MLRSETKSAKRSELKAEALAALCWRDRWQSDSGVLKQNAGYSRKWLDGLRIVTFLRNRTKSIVCVRQTALYFTRWGNSINKNFRKVRECHICFYVNRLKAEISQD